MARDTEVMPGVQHEFSLSYSFGVFLQRRHAAFLSCQELYASANWNKETCSLMKCNVQSELCNVHLV
jgi:hypothetical protein